MRAAENDRGIRDAPVDHRVEIIPDGRQIEPLRLRQLDQTRQGGERRAYPLVKAPVDERMQLFPADRHGCRADQDLFVRVDRGSGLDGGLHPDDRDREAFAQRGDRHARGGVAGDDDRLRAPFAER